MRASAAVLVDLWRLRDAKPAALRGAVWAACAAPDGTTVTVRVGVRQMVDYSAVAVLRQEGAHLGSVIVRCEDPSTIREWVDALNGSDGLGL